MIDSENGFKIVKIKTYDQVDWLSKIPIYMINKYWLKMSEELSDIITIGFDVVDHTGNKAGEVIEIKDDMFLCQLDEPINYTDLISIGIPITNIVFDNGQHFRLGNSSEEKIIEKK